MFNNAGMPNSAKAVSRIYEQQFREKQIQEQKERHLQSPHTANKSCTRKSMFYDTHECCFSECQSMVFLFIIVFSFFSHIILNL